MSSSLPYPSSSSPHPPPPALSPALRRTAHPTNVSALIAAQLIPSHPHLSSNVSFHSASVGEQLEIQERLDWNSRTGTSDRLLLRPIAPSDLPSLEPILGGGGGRDRWGNRWSLESHVLSPVISERTEPSYTSTSSPISSQSISSRAIQPCNPVPSHPPPSLAICPAYHPSSDQGVHPARAELSLSALTCPSSQDTPAFLQPSPRRSKSRRARDQEARERDLAIANRQIQKRAERERRDQMVRRRDAILQQLVQNPKDPKLVRELGRVYLQNHISSPRYQTLPSTHQDPRSSSQRHPGSGKSEASLKLSIHYLEQSIQLDKSDPETWMFLGQAWALLLHHHPSDDPKERTRRLSNSSLGFRKAIALANRQCAPSGHSEGRDARKSNSQENHFRWIINKYRLAYVEYLEELSRFREAAEVLQQGLEHNPTDVECWWKLGRMMELWALDKCGHLPKDSKQKVDQDTIEKLRHSQEAYRRAVELEPGDEAMREGLKSLQDLLRRLNVAGERFSSKENHETTTHPSQPPPVGGRHAEKARRNPSHLPSLKIDIGTLIIPKFGEKVVKQPNYTYPPPEQPSQVSPHHENKTPQPTSQPVQTQEVPEDRHPTPTQGSLKGVQAPEPSELSSPNLKHKLEDLKARLHGLMDDSVQTLSPLNPDANVQEEAGPRRPPSPSMLPTPSYHSPCSSRRSYRPPPTSGSRKEQGLEKEGPAPESPFFKAGSDVDARVDTSNGRGSISPEARSVRSCQTIESSQRSSQPTRSILSTLSPARQNPLSGPSLPVGQTSPWSGHGNVLGKSSSPPPAVGLVAPVTTVFRPAKVEAQPHRTQSVLPGHSPSSPCGRPPPQIPPRPMSHRTLCIPSHFCPPQQQAAPATCLGDSPLMPSPPQLSGWSDGRLTNPTRAYVQQPATEDATTCDPQLDYSSVAKKPLWPLPDDAPGSERQSVGGEERRRRAPTMMNAHRHRDAGFETEKPFGCDRHPQLQHLRQQQQQADRRPLSCNVGNFPVALLPRMVGETTRESEGKDSHARYHRACREQWSKDEDQSLRASLGAWPPPLLEEEKQMRRRSAVVGSGDGGLGGTGGKRRTSRNVSSLIDEHLRSMIEIDQERRRVMEELKEKIEQKDIWADRKRMEMLERLKAKIEEQEQRETASEAEEEEPEYTRLIGGGGLAEGMVSHDEAVARIDRMVDEGVSADRHHHHHLQGDRLGRRVSHDPDHLHLVPPPVPARPPSNPTFCSGGGSDCLDRTLVGTPVAAASAAQKRPSSVAVVSNGHPEPHHHQHRHNRSSAGLALDGIKSIIQLLQQQQQQQPQKEDRIL